MFKTKSGKNILKNIQLTHIIFSRQRDIKDSSEMEYVVDMQGFKQPGNDSVLKELAILCLSDNSEPRYVSSKNHFHGRGLQISIEKRIYGWSITIMAYPGHRMILTILS